jgi:hypothetical protein
MQDEAGQRRRIEGGRCDTKLLAGAVPAST